MKRHLILSMLILLALLALFAWGCVNGAGLNGNTQIGIITNVVNQSQGGCVFTDKLAVQNEENGGPLVVHAYWPDAFMTEPEQVQQIVQDMLRNPKIGALIMRDMIPGAASAVKAATDPRRKMFCVSVYGGGDDAAAIAAQVDLVLNLDIAALGGLAAEQARRLGAQTLVYYYHPQHMREAIYAQQFAAAEQACADLELDFIAVELPTGDLQLPTPDFLKRDMSRRVQEYGQDTAFFSPVLGSVPSLLVEQVVQLQAIYPLPCLPTPYLGYPDALGIDFDYGSYGAQGYGDYAYINAQIAQYLAGKNVSGRLASFKVDYADLEIRAAYEYAVKWLKGEVPKEGVDLTVLQQIMENISGAVCHLRPYQEDGVVYDNYALYCLEPYV